MYSRGASSGRLLLVGAAALAAACSREGPPVTAHSSHLSLPYSVHQDASGLRLLVAPDMASDIVHVAVRYRVGSGADPEGKAGLAHLAQRLTFAARPGGTSIVSMLDRIALAHGASTELDGTYYWAAAPADRLTELLEIEAQRLGVTCDAIDDDAFAAEVEAARGELHFRAPDVEEAYLARMEAAYGLGHPYHRPPSGYDRDLAAMTRADACAFLRDHYAADRAAVVVTGPVDPARVRSLVARLF